MTHALAAAALLALVTCMAPQAVQQAASPTPPSFVAAASAMWAPQAPFDDTPIGPAETAGAARAE